MRDKTRFIYTVLVGGVILFVPYAKLHSTSVGTFELRFRGTASGGSLVLADALNRASRYVSIQTSPGESAESVAQRLADTINACHAAAAIKEPPHRFNLHRLWVGGYQATASRGTLTIPGPSGNYILAGTENGLGIPERPLFLSCSYNEQKDHIVARWVNPADEYDFILVHSRSADHNKRGIRRVLGTSTNYTIDRNKVAARLNHLDIWVVGFRANLPSNAAAIHVSGYGHCQEETYGIPFSGGVAPNWRTWSTAAKTDTSAFQQGAKYTNLRFYNPVEALSTKPFYQVIKAPAKGAAHGIYRKFLGLTPGHTYRITACLSTLAMDSIMADWSFSLHAAPTAAGKDLTVQQLAGSVALPYAKSGPTAGRITSHSQGTTTKGTHQIVLSRDKVADGPESTHITLPPRVDTITVWVRFSCSDPKGEVGFAGVKLEDITASPKVKSADQIMSEEVSAEAELLGREQRARGRQSP